MVCSTLYNTGVTITLTIEAMKIFDIRNKKVNTLKEDSVWPTKIRPLTDFIKTFSMVNVRHFKYSSSLRFQGESYNFYFFTESFCSTLEKRVILISSHFIYGDSNEQACFSVPVYSS